jgi:prepilin signal peptidase PulO-like enzyme (type II secretory pathway)
METLVAFLLLSIPAAVIVERLIWRLTANIEDWAGEPGRRVLPWQDGPPSTWLRFGFALLVPPLMLGAALRFEAGPALAACVLLIALLICSATDLLRYRIPNVVTYPSVALALVAALAMPEGDFTGAVAAAGVSAALFVSVWALTRGGIGFADVKFAVLIGAALGLPSAYSALALGVFLGGLVMAALLAAGAVNRRQVTPYAPFFALSAIAVVFVRGTSFAPL